MSRSKVDRFEVGNDVSPTGYYFLLAFKTSPFMETEFIFQKEANAMLIGFEIFGTILCFWAAGRLFRIAFGWLNEIFNELSPKRFKQRRKMKTKE